MPVDARGLFWAPRAWLGSGPEAGWHEQVVLEADVQGRWQAVSPGVAKPEGAQVLAGPVLPGLVDAHSHAFQRAFAGLAERREQASDDFWSWRDRMYRVALRVDASALKAIATQLYTELLHGGYTQVCEFHYLHHQPDGKPYEDPLELSWALADAAQAAGIGLTMLPVLYQRAGFSQHELRDDQRRFAGTPMSVWKAHEQLMRSKRPLLHAGVAIHSLRAAAPESITALQRLVGQLENCPIHIHIAEQSLEVDDCVTATGMRPIDWLCRTMSPDSRWHLVHATHATPAEIDAVAARGAGVVLCPSTEGNLGDGLADLTRWLAAGVPCSIGSDSHVTRAWPEELRWLDYGQRLHRRARNVSASPEHGQPSTAARLFDVALRAGAAAAGFPTWGLVPGARADLLVLDVKDSALLGVPPERTLDALVFSSPGDAIRDVYVAGHRVIENRCHPNADAQARIFERAMQALWAEEG